MEALLVVLEAGQRLLWGTHSECWWAGQRGLVPECLSLAGSGPPPPPQPSPSSHLPREGCLRAPRRWRALGGAVTTPLHGTDPRGSRRSLPLHFPTLGSQPLLGGVSASLCLSFFPLFLCFYTPPPPTSRTLALYFPILSCSKGLTASLMTRPHLQPLSLCLSVSLSGLPWVSPSFSDPVLHI